MLTKKDYISQLNKELCDGEDEFTRDEVYKVFEKFVENKESLQRAIDFGVFQYDYVKYKTLFKGTLFEEGMLLFISLCNRAHEKEPEKFKKIMQEYYPIIAKGHASQTQMCWLDGISIENERNDLFVKKSFRIMGDLIENSCKPFVMFLNEMRCLVTDKVMKQQKLGTVVDMLINYHETFRGLYKDLLLGVSLSQWRNIADHGSFESKDEGAYITYGPNGEKEISVSRQELVELLNSIDTLLYMHKTAYTLVSVEYVAVLSEVASCTKDREETWNDNVIAQMVETSCAYCFELCDIDKNDERWKVVVSSKKKPDKEQLTQYLSVIAAIMKEYEITIKRAGKVEYKALCINRKLSIYQFRV